MDPVGPVPPLAPRIEPAARLRVVRRDEERRDEQERRHPTGGDEPETPGGEGEDDGLPHVDVRV